MEWPEFVNIVGQTKQESLFALRGGRDGTEKTLLDEMSNVEGVLPK